MKTQQQLDFTQFVLKVGLDNALQIFGEQVWEKAKLTFEQWKDKSDRIIRRDQALNEKVLAKLVETASTSGHWLQLWKMAPADSSLHLMVIKKFKEELKTLTTFYQLQRWRPMSLKLDFFNGDYKELNAVWLDRLAEAASSLWDWSIVRNEALNSRFGNNDLAAKALTKMVDCATRTGTAEDWMRVYHEAPVGIHTKQALAFFANQAKTSDDWFNVWYRARDKDNSDLARYAWLETIASASTFQEWFSILAHIKDDDTATRALCLNKLVGLAKTLKDWLSIYQSSGGRIRNNALFRVLARAGTLDEWLSVWHSTPEGSAEKTRALVEIRSFVKLD